MVVNSRRMQCAVLALLALAIASCVPGCFAYVKDGKILYNPKYMAEYNVIGGDGGGAFDTTTCDTSSTFDIIKRIKIYYAMWTINGVFIETTSGQLYTYGSADCDSSELVFKHTADEVDTVTSLSLWGNCEGTRLGGIKLTTKSGQTLDVGMKCKSRCSEYNIPLGSGIPCGIFGRSGSELDAFGMSFLRKVTSKRLQVDSIQPLQQGHSVVTFNGGSNGYRTVDNRKGSNPFITSVQETTKRTNSEVMESQSTFKYSQGLEITFTQKLIVKEVSETQIGVKATIGFEQAYNYRTSRTTTEETTTTVSDQYTCPAGSLCDFFDYTITGVLEAEYKGRIVYELDNGARTKYYDVGKYSLKKDGYRKTLILTYCCNPDKCKDTTPNIDDKRVCDTRPIKPAWALPTGGDMPYSADVADFSFPANITLLPLDDMVVVTPTSDDALATTAAAAAAAATSPEVAVATVCTASPDTCTWVPTSPRSLRVQQGPPGSGVNILGEVSPIDVSNFANSTLSRKSLVSLSLHGCDFGKDCVYEAEVKLLSASTSLTCQPGSVVMTLVTKSEVGRQLDIPGRARNMGARLRVVGVNNGGQCVLQLQTLMKSPKSASSSSGLQQTLSGLEGVACAIGMAKCDRAGIADATACCKTLPPVSITPQGGCGNCPACFPGDAMVVLEGDVKSTMDQLKIGDKVQVLTADGQLRYEPVYLFGHKDSKAVSTMIQLAAVSSTSREVVHLTLSPDHFVPVAACLKGHIMTRAKDVAVGDRLWAVSGQNFAEPFEVVTVTAEAAQGLFNPFTPAGTIVVNGVVASVHSEWFLDHFMDRLGATHFIPTVYQAILLPLYYTVYCVLGPAWVRFFDDNVDFAKVGTINPAVTLISVWSCVSAVTIPMLIVASKVAKTGKKGDR